MPPLQWGYFMSVSTKSILRAVEALGDLEQQMSELLALRRALCLANASRNRPRGARRSLGRAVRAVGRLSDDRYSSSSRTTKYRTGAAPGHQEPLGGLRADLRLLSG